MRRAQLQDLLGVTGGIIANVFRRMEIAEEIANRHFPRRGKPSARNSLAFKVACPPPLLRDKGDDLYGAHMEELCRRITSGADLDVATDAELLAAFSETSLRSPLRHGATLIMDNLFASCFPDRASRLGITIHELEPVALEDLDAARRKLSAGISRLG